MKQKYFNATIKAAHLQMDYGRVGRNIGVVTFCRLLSASELRNVDDQKITSDLRSGFKPRRDVHIEHPIAHERIERRSDFGIGKIPGQDECEGIGRKREQDYIALLQSVGENQKSASRASG